MAGAGTRATRAGWLSPPYGAGPPLWLTRSLSSTRAAGPRERKVKSEDPGRRSSSPGPLQLGTGRQNLPHHSPSTAVQIKPKPSGRTGSPSRAAPTEASLAFPGCHAAAELGTAFPRLPRANFRRGRPMGSPDPSRRGGREPSRVLVPVDAGWRHLRSSAPRSAFPSSSQPPREAAVAGGF